MIERPAWIPNGTVTAVELERADISDKIVADDWGQAGVGSPEAPRAHAGRGQESAENITAVVLGETKLDRPPVLGIGMRLPYRD